ncbi:hypothetical protein OG394_06155 [Kribbella sp. NBC_01245]|uniref:hypothetical protein n=1 Tax=Kribbella sp. NBC_01245 TaxID=2903578 RepID=UPI002E2D4E07|nr:hypothetical protein [Kribbella sp. NBC_01245]
MDDDVGANRAGREVPPDIEETWAELRCAYYRERVAEEGSADDYVGLVRAMLQLHGMGVNDALEEAFGVLCDAVDRHPRSVSAWEHVAYVSSVTRRSEEMANALAVLERLDPTSRVLAAAGELRADDSRQWAHDAHERQWNLLDEAGSGDADTRAAAVAELERWARSFPANSTYAVNYALGLLAADQPAESQRVALAAWAIEDGSFADAYNVSLVLRETGAQDEGRAILMTAMERASSDQERQLVAEAVAEDGPG